MHLSDWLEFQLLLREARELLDSSDEPRKTVLHGICVRADPADSRIGSERLRWVPWLGFSCPALPAAGIFPFMVSPLFFAAQHQERKHMHRPAPTGWFFDPDQTCDEVLLLLAREGCQQPAGAALTRRHWHRLRAELARCPASRGLSPWDLEDAQQQAYFWIQEAILAFDAGQLIMPRGSSFRTFLHRVVRLRLLDFRRAVRRNNSHFQTVGQIDDFSDPVHGDAGLAASASSEDFKAALEDALPLRDPLTRALWKELCQGKRLLDLPKVLDVSYRTLKRRWRSLREHLA
jgi:DNA-directed RNA polymerase specialized sigma24 family protein